MFDQAFQVEGILRGEEVLEYAVALVLIVLNVFLQWAIRREGPGGAEAIGGAGISAMLAGFGWVFVPCLFALTLTCFLVPTAMLMRLMLTVLWGNRVSCFDPPLSSEEAKLQVWFAILLNLLGALFVLLALSGSEWR